MGTNYYLLHKVNNLTERIDAIYNYRSETGIFNYDYLEDNEENTTVEKLHIGKSSYGWRFSLCAYPALNINTLEDWLGLFKEEDVIILNEYENVISIEEMYDIIANRSGEVINLEPYEYNNGVWLDTKHNLIAHNIKTHQCDIDVTYDITNNPDFS